MRLLAFNPLSVVVVTSEVAADIRVDGAVVVQSTVQNQWKHTALRRNGCGVAPFMEKNVTHQHQVTLNSDTQDVTRSLSEQLINVLRL